MICRRAALLPLLGAAALAVSACSFQPVSDVLASLSAQEREAVAAQTSSPTPGCAAQTLQDASCMTEQGWTAAAEELCAQDARSASRLLLAGACGAGSYQVAAFECCPAGPPQPGCEGSVARMQGGASSCKDKPTWTSYAEYECGEFGMFLDEASLRFVTECEPYSYEAIFYDCCPLAPGATWSLASEFGPSRPELFGGASGWVYDTDTCGPGPECVGYDWRFAETCRFELFRRHAAPAEYVLPEPDCGAFKRWLTSDVFLAGLDSSCGAYRGDEATAVALLNGEDHRKKYKDCPGEPFVSHRAILEALVSKYFP